jgi:hypothetical protein
MKPPDGPYIDTAADQVSTIYKRGAINQLSLLTAVAWSLRIGNIVTMHRQGLLVGAQSRHSKIKSTHLPYRP